MTREQLQTRLEKLEAARDGGVQSIKDDGSEIIYRTDLELARAIADLRRRLALLDNVLIRRINPIYCKGF